MGHQPHCKPRQGRHCSIMMNNIELNLLLLESPHAWRRHNTQVNMKKVSAVIYPPYTKIEKLERDGVVGMFPLCSPLGLFCVSQWPLDPLLFERGFSKKRNSFDH